MILVIHISNSRIRASYLDHDMNPIHIPLSKGREAYFLDPGLYIDDGFAFTGEYIESMKMNNPEIKIPEDLSETDRFTLLFKYVLFKSNAIVTDDFQYAFIVHPTHAGEDYIAALKTAVIYNGLKWVGSISHEEALQSKLEGDKKAVPFILRIDNSTITNNVSNDVCAVFKLIKDQLLTKLISEIQKTFSKEWLPLPIDQLRLSLLSDLILSELFISDKSSFTKFILINNSAIHINISNAWKSQIQVQYSMVLKKYLLEIEKSQKCKLSEYKSLVLSGPFAKVPFILQVLFELSENWKNNYVIDSDDLRPIEDALSEANLIFKEIEQDLSFQDMDNGQISMPSELKNITINNLVS